MTTTVTVVRSLEHYPTVLVGNITSWQRATKTRPIWTKHIQNVLCDGSIMAKLLLSTIEADQMLKSNSMICRGEAGDVWQQSAEKMLKKYTVTDVDSEGWMICTPKPDNAVECYPVVDVSANYNPSAIM